MPLFSLCLFYKFFFNDTATTEIYTLSLHDALPISSPSGAALRMACASRREKGRRWIDFSQSTPACSPKARCAPAFFAVSAGAGGGDLTRGAAALKTGAAKTAIDFGAGLRLKPSSRSTASAVG